MTREPRRWRYWLILAIVAAAVLALARHAPIPQDTSYHAFADCRSALGIPNIANVLSNLPFLLVGVAGLLALYRERLPGALKQLFAAYTLFFFGSALIAFGSAYYHLAPDNGTLVCDRLPMTLAFMAFVAIIIGEHLRPAWGRRGLPLLLLFGILSVVYWWLTEMRGHGDLRPYVLVQFLPILLIPIILLLFPSALSNVGLMWATVGTYAAAKVLELLDERIYRALRMVSGHTLKHLMAAVGVYCLLLALRRRSPVARAEPVPPSPVFHAPR